MRILLITGRDRDGNPSQGEAYEFQNFLPALLDLGYEVEVLDNLDRTGSESFTALNRSLLTRVEEWRPDVVLYMQFRYEIWIETWDILRKSGIAATLHFAADDSWKFKQASRLLMRHFDACCTTYADKVAAYTSRGYTSVLKSQWAADARRLQPPLPASECKYDVTFIGQCYGRRSYFVDALVKAGIRVDCFGSGWPNGPVPSERISPTLRSSKITLNFSGSGSFWERFLPGHRQIKARVFEVPGSGGFLLTEWSPGTEKEYDLLNEIDVFHTAQELVDKVKHYLQNPDERDKRALAAYQRTVLEHTYDTKMRAMVDFAILSHRESSTGTGTIDWKAFEKAAQQHSLTPGLSALRTVLARTFSLIWGTERGPRAARKFLFELSWRLAGEQTYSASGWPGRMFYRES